MPENVVVGGAPAKIIRKNAGYRLFIKYVLKGNEHEIFGAGNTETYCFTG